MRSLLRGVVLVVLATAVSSCGAADPDAADRGAAAPTSSAPAGEPTTPPAASSRDESPTSPSDRPEREPPSSPSEIASEPGGDVPTSAVPGDVLDPVLAAAADEAGVAVDELEVVRAQPARWPDGSLGCPEPGMSYTQAIVDGYWVVVRAADRELDYRLGSRGGFRLCEGGGSPPMARDDL